MSQSLKIVKRRIRSAKNIKQITKAMEMVSASKMRRSQENALSTRPYSTKLKEVLSELASQTKTDIHPMLKTPDTTKGVVGIILVSSDRGLCGALNSNLFRATEEFLDTLGQERPEEIVSFEFIAVGKKAREFVLKTGRTLHAEFTNIQESPKFEDVLPITHLAIEGFSHGRYKEIFIVYTDFISTLRQEVNSLRLLPVETRKLEEVQRDDPNRPYREYIFEPDIDVVIDQILPHYIEIQTYQTILEALASEHSARMVAMRNASENATEIIVDLTLAYNKQRQQSITNELSDLITSRIAVS